MLRMKALLYDVPALLLLILLTLAAYRPLLITSSSSSSSSDQQDQQLPEWEFLWDDNGNFANSHMSLTMENIIWAFRDGTIHSVYEPVSLIIKMIIHSALPAFGVEMDPRMYRIINLCAHIINVCLVFLIGRLLLVAANDYEFYDHRLQSLIILKKERLKVLAGGGKGGASNKRKKMGSAGDDPSERPEDTKIWIDHAQKASRNLRTHQSFATVGCWIGTALFAVHPLQAHSIGWASCMSYFFACTFSLLSFWKYAEHRIVMRRWRRSKKEVIGVKGMSSSSGSKVAEPWQIFRPSVGDAKRSYDGKKAKRSGAAVATFGTSQHETFVLTSHKIAALIFYVLATFCKAPAIVLPVIFVICDVFVWSSPLGVHPFGPAMLEDMLGEKPANDGSVGISSLLNLNNNIQSFPVAFPKLWRMTLRAIKASTIYFLATPFMIVFILSGNKGGRTVVLSVIEKIETAALALGWYIVKLVAPANLCATVEIRHISLFGDWRVAACLALIPYATIALLAHSLFTTPMRLAACAWGSMVALLFPALGFVQHTGNSVYAADRYMYLPLSMAAPILGAALCGCFTLITSSSLPVVDKVICAGGPIPDSVTSKSASNSAIDVFDASCIAEAVDDKKGGKKGRSGASSGDSSFMQQKDRLDLGEVKRHGTVYLIVITLLSLGAIWVSAHILTPTNLNYWRTSQILWERNIEFYPDSINAHNPLATLYSSVLDPPDYDKALFHAKSAVLLNPTVYENRFNLAAIHVQRNDLDEAVAIFRSLLKENPRHGLVPTMVVEYAIALHRMGEWDAAQRELEQAVKLREPRAKDALVNILKMRTDPDGEKKQKEWWRKLKESRSQNSTNGQQEEDDTLSI